MCANFLIFFLISSVYTKEKIRWVPTAPASRTRGQIAQPSREAALQMAKASPWQFVDPTKAEPGVGGTGGGDAPLPPGWTPVESASRPGEYSYVNDNTGEKARCARHRFAA